MLIKIIKLVSILRNFLTFQFAVLLPLEERLAKKLAEPLITIINETNAMSLMYECIQTCIVGLHENKMVMRLCISKLRMFIEHPDQNCLYSFSSITDLK